MPDTNSETNVPIGEWTLGALKIYHDDKIASLKELTERRFIEQEKAVDKANVASEKRFDGVNEFRKTLSDQTATFIPRAETEQRLSALAEKITAQAERISAAENLKQGAELTVGKMVTIVGVSVSVLGFVLGIIVFAANGKF